MVGEEVRRWWWSSGGRRRKGKGIGMDGEGGAVAVVGGEGGGLLD